MLVAKLVAKLAKSHLQTQPLISKTLDINIDSGFRFPEQIGDGQVLKGRLQFVELQFVRKGKLFACNLIQSFEMKSSKNR